jgi:hypothetical protein
LKWLAVAACHTQPEKTDGQSAGEMKKYMALSASEIWSKTPENYFVDGVWT